MERNIGLADCRMSFLSHRKSTAEMTDRALIPVAPAMVGPLTAKGWPWLQLHK